VVARKETVLDALPVDPVPLALPVEPPRPPRTFRPVIQRNHLDVTVSWDGHFVRVENNPWFNTVRILHDAREVGGGWVLFEWTWPFAVLEDGEQVRYEVVVRSANLSFQMRPGFTITRNGQVLFNDR
jgi:hypothetical protein